MRLSQLLTEVPGAQLVGAGDVSINSVCYDSRRSVPESLFVAVPGFKVDGHEYVAEALEAGAGAVTVQADEEAKWRGKFFYRGISPFVVPDNRGALAQIPAALYGHSAGRAVKIGITRAGGKTRPWAPVWH